MRTIDLPALGLLLLAACGSPSQSSGATPGERMPVAGLSIIEDFPATPAEVTLRPDAALVDGVTTGTTQLDIGFAASLAGDSRYRDAGIQLPNASTEVNLLRIWTAPALLPPDVFAALSWSVWASEDNLHWAQVALASPPLLEVVSTFVVLPISSTSARYLKIVTRPLVPAATSDARYAHVFVTEVRAFFSTQ